VVDPILFIVASLATYRLARMVTQEEGPFGIFVRWRGAIDPDQETWVGRGVNCALCVGFWIALPMSYAVTGLTWLWPIVWWATAGAAALLQKWEYKT
jgi:hypothetical protein